MSARYDFLIVGAGLSGATFARLAHDAGARCLVIDRRSRVGGNAATFTIEGIVAHEYGAHIFHTDDEGVWRFVNRFARFEPYIHAPLALSHRRVFNLPFNMNTFARLWGVTTPDEARGIIAEQTAPHQLHPPKNLEQQALSLVGRDIYEALVREYTQKQWGRPCDQLPTGIITRLPLRFTYDNRYFDDRYQGIPEGGYTPMAQALLEGCEVRLSTPFDEALRAQADRVVFTGAIDAYYGYRYGALPWRSLRFEHALLDRDNYQGCSVVNHIDADIPYTRVIEHRHFAPRTASAKTLITREYPQAYAVGLEPFYPIADNAGMALYARYKALANAERDHTLFLGRLGSYRYLDMDEAVAEAMALARETLR